MIFGFWFFVSFSLNHIYINSTIDFLPDECIIIVNIFIVKIIF